MTDFIAGAMAPFLRRPLFGAAVFLILGMLIGLNGGVWLLVLAMSLLGMAFFLLVRKRRCRTPCFGYLLLLPAGFFLMTQALSLSSFSSQINDNCIEATGSVEGTVYRVRYKNSTWQYYLKDVLVTSEDGCLDHSYQAVATENTIVYCNSEASDISLGDTIWARGKLKAYDRATNPGQFDCRLYYQTQKICYRVSASSVRLLCANTNPVLELAGNFRNRMEKVYASIADEESASVFCAILLGDKDNLDEDISDLFSLNGIGHILAISGLHISLIGMGLYRLLRRLGLKALPAMLVGATVILFYGLVTGNGVSTVRALIMFITAVYAQVIGRSYDLLSGASLAAILMLAYSPLYLCQCGFLLSFGAVMGIAFLVPAFRKLLPTHNKILTSLYGSLGIQMITTPITLYYYFQFPVYAILLNLIVIPLMSVVMISGLAGGLGGMMTESLGTFCLAPGVYVIRFYEVLCNWIQKLPYASVTVGRPATWKLLIYYGLLVVFLYLAARRPRKRTAALCLAAVVVLFLPLPSGLTVSFLDVGQGDGIFIRAENGTNILVDGGSTSESKLYENVLEPFLQSQGVSELDYWIMSHADEDHINGAVSLLENQTIKVKQVLLPAIGNPDESYRKVEEAALSAGAEITYISQGDQLKAGKLTIDVLYPYANIMTEERNCYSTCLMVREEDFSMLLTGDICSDEEEILADVVKQYAPFTVCKAAHHGSKYSNSLAFLQTVAPEIAVISCALDNDYGHPAKEAVGNLQAAGADIYYTMEAGCITITRNFGKISVREEVEEAYL